MVPSNICIYTVNEIISFNLHNNLRDTNFMPISRWDSERVNEAMNEDSCSSYFVISSNGIGVSFERTFKNTIYSPCEHIL